jgi:hypothetical protein
MEIREGIEMVEALIAFVLAVLILAVFHSPAWAITLASFGALGFSLYVLILVVEWVIGKVK